MIGIRLALAGLCAGAALAQAPPAAVPKPAPRSAAPPKPATSRAPGEASWKDLKYEPLRLPRLPAATRFELPNGMKLLLVEDHETPLLTGVAIVRTGMAFDPPGRAGLAALTGGLLRAGGTRLKTSEEMDAALEALGATLETAIGETAATVTLTALQENAAPALRLLYETLAEPGFRQDRVDRAKVLAWNDIARRNEDAREMLKREFQRLLYGPGSAYGQRAENGTIAAIGRPDIVRFYRRYFFPANTLLALCGDFDAAAMKTAVEEIFAGWKGRPAPVPELPKAGPESAGGYVAWKNDLKETYYLLGRRLDFDAREPDAPAIEVAAAILGGTAQSRLERLRQGRRADIRALRAEAIAGRGFPGMFFITGEGASPATADAAKMALDEVQRLRDAEVGEDELRAGREAALLRLAAGLDNRATALRAIAAFDSFGYPPDFLDRYFKAVATVTRADVLRAARERLDPQAFTVAAASNLTVFRRPLDPRGGETKRIDLTIPPLPPAEAPPPPDTSSLEEGKRLLARAQQAAGGADRLAAVKDMTAVTSYRLAGGGKDTETDQWVAPSHLRQEGISSKLGTILRYTDGRVGWVSNGRASLPLTGPGLRNTLGDLFRVPFLLLLSDRDRDRSVAALDEETVEISGGGHIVRLVFDPQTGLPAQLLYSVWLENGRQGAVEEELSGYRDVGGIKLPSASIVYQNGSKYAEGVTEYKLNQGLKVENLQRRP